MVSPFLEAPISISTCIWPLLTSSNLKGLYNQWSESLAYPALYKVGFIHVYKTTLGICWKIHHTSSIWIQIQNLSIHLPTSKQVNTSLPMRDQNLRSWWCYFCLTLRIIGPSKLAILCYFEDTTPAVQVQTLPLEGPRSLGDEDFSEDTPNVTLLVGWFSLSPVVKSCYAIHVWKSALAVTFSVAMLKRKSHTIHGTGIFTYIWLILIVHVVVTSL